MMWKQVARWGGSALGGLSLVALIAAGCARDEMGSAAGAASDVGPFKIAAGNQPDPPSNGDNTLTFAIRDREGRPVRGATVSVLVSMPAMGAMPRMESRGRVEEARPGVYRARYGLAMNGEWDVVVRVAPAGDEAVEGAWRLSTSVRGLSFKGGTPAGGGAAARPGADSATAAPVGEIVLDAERRQSLGIRTARVAARDLASTVRAVGRVAWDESRQSEVTLKYAGTVRAIQADFTGRPVRKGETLFSVYSPELWSAEQEYVEARFHGAADSAAGGNAEGGTPLAEAARQRLQLWDVGEAEIARLERTRQVREAVPVLAPLSGVITEKSVVRGSAFTPGQALYKIAPSDPVWVIASVYQLDLPLISVGMPARLLDPYSDAASRRGRVSFISPSLERDTRTLDVRVEVPNPRGDLKPGMFVDVELEGPARRALAVPESAVLPTGERHVVFLDLGGGRLAPREVRLGRRAGEWYEVLSGLSAGDVVVTSGNFLVAAESKLRSASQKW